MQSMLLCAVALLGFATATPLPQERHVRQCGVAGVQVRLPPAFVNGSTSQDRWYAYEPDWYFKPWNMVYASNPSNLALRNFQYDPSPVDPNNPWFGPVNDLGSFQVPGNDTVYTTYGVDTQNAHDTFNNVYHYAGTGILEGATSDYSILAWGCDENRIPYYVNYASYTELTKTPAGIDIMSTSVNGMDEKTLDAIVTKLKALGNMEIADMAAAIKPMTNDGARDGMPRITTCDDECKTNQGLLDILG